MAWYDEAVFYHVYPLGEYWYFRRLKNDENKIFLDIFCIFHYDNRQ